MGSILIVTIASTETLRADVTACPAPTLVDVRWSDPLIGDSDVVITMGGLS